MDAVMLDAILAYLHHLGIGILIACLAMETALVRGPFTPSLYNRLARIDAGVGFAAGLILFAGIGRVMYGLKGAEFYTDNHVFWTKMALFALAAGASIPVTINLLKWRKAAMADADFQPPPEKLRLVQRHIKIEWALILLIPLAAVLMARGFGMR
jgi:putative membrane protein